MDIFTQFIKEKRWIKTSKEEALKIIEKEMPETDPKSTLSYILEEIKRGKTITLGECKFKSEQG